MISPKIEIMSPVGSYESLMAAIQAGAGSVYFGIGNLNMRSRSSYNFQLNDISKIADICNNHGTRSYITLNTVIYDEELETMRKIIDHAKENNISAVIVSDQAAINYAYANDMEIHLSTQLSISNIESLKFYSKFADVTVLARELTINHIHSISEQIRKEQITGPSGQLIRLEAFVHGALCLAISGKCFMSLHQHNASANRGACYQVCRREFRVSDENGNEMILDNRYILSPKDLCTIKILDKIMGAGVSVLKIEGRGRSAEYVKTTTRIYREAVNAIVNGEFTPDKADLWSEELKKVYNRGFWEGHYLGEHTSSWNTDIYGSKATTQKIYHAKVIKYFSKMEVGEFFMETGELNKGDSIIISGPTTGVLELTVNELRIENQVVSQVKKGDTFSLKVGKQIRPSDKLYRIINLKS